MPEDTPIHPFFALLFEAYEYTCLSDSAKGTRLLPARLFDPSLHTFFAINALDAKRDRVPTAPYHNPHVPRRADGNVVSYRNILIEMDGMSLDEQQSFVKAKDLPFSSCVYSGGKSYHFVLSLDEPLSDAFSYSRLVRAVHEALENKADGACRNPSRLSRTPGAFRMESGRRQDLIELRGRIPLAELMAWLDFHGHSMDDQNRARHIAAKRAVPQIGVRASTMQFLKEGAPEGSWNIELFKAACDAFEAGWEYSAFELSAAAITGHLDNNDRATLLSAWQRTHLRAGA